MATYKLDDNLKALGDSVIRKYPRFAHLSSDDCRIAYQLCGDQRKHNGKAVYADTEKIKDKLKAIIPYDFVITFYEPFTSGLSQEKLEMLMYHELEHVGFKGVGSYYIVPHDIEDFRDVVSQWGLDWI